MLKKIWTIFVRDLRVNLRDFMSLYILLVPVLLSFGINALAPSVNDTTVNLALLEGANSEQVAYLEHEMAQNPARPHDEDGLCDLSGSCAGSPLHSPAGRGGIVHVRREIASLPPAAK